MTSAVSAFGAKLDWNSVDIAEVTSISGPSMKVDMLDATSHDSANTFREFVAGLADGGEVTFEGNFKAADTAGIIAFITDMQARQARTCKVELPASLGYWSGTAYAIAFDMSFPHDEIMTFTATVKYTGKPTLTIS